MEDAERFRLLGKYRTPRFRIGQRVFCAVRGEVTISGINDAPILWPLCKCGQSAQSLVVYKDLILALVAGAQSLVTFSAEERAAEITTWDSPFKLGMGMPRGGNYSTTFLLDFRQYFGEFHSRAIQKASRCSFQLLVWPT
jgi:hypothetical protein